MNEEVIKELIVELEKRMNEDKSYMANLTLLFHEGFIAGLKYGVDIDVDGTPWLVEQLEDIIKKKEGEVK